MGRKKVPERELFADLARVKELKGARFSMQDYEELGAYSIHTLIRRFGAWTNILLAAGFELEAVEVPKNTKESLIETIRTLAQELDGIPSASLFTSRSGIKLSSVRHFFGTYKAFLAEAGLSTVSTLRGTRTPEEAKKRRDSRRRKKGFFKEAMRTNTAYSISFEQNIVRELLEKVLGVGLDIEYEKTWDWLKNPKTDCKLRVDMYLKDFNVAVEYQSGLHFKPSPYFDKHNIQDTLYRDYLKRTQLRTNGISLFEVAYFELQDKEALLDRIKSNF